MTLPLVVIKGAGCNLLGRNWFPHLGIQITGINDVSGDELVSKLLDKYQSVFDEDISGHIGPAFFLLVIFGTAVCTVLVHIVLFRKSKPHRGAVLILHGADHPYIRHPLPTLRAGRRRRQNRSCPNKYDRQVFNALKRSDQFIVQKLLRSAEYNRTIAYEDDSGFPTAPVNDLFPYSAFLVTRDDVRHVDIIALVPTDHGRLNKIQKKTACYVDVENVHVFNNHRVQYRG
ncbi:hypothetical protein MRX96_049355 [Rhipicephalus microplus]